VVVIDFVIPVNLTVCSALSLYHCLVTVDLQGRSSLLALPEQQCLKQVGWTHFWDHLCNRLNENPRVDSVKDMEVRPNELTSAILEAITVPAAKRQLAKQPQLLNLPTIFTNIHKKTRLRRQWQIDSNPITKNLNQLHAKVDWF
jgi:hypothetical protein